MSKDNKKMNNQTFVMNNKFGKIKARHLLLSTFFVLFFLTAVVKGVFHVFFNQNSVNPSHPGAVSDEEKKGIMDIESLRHDLRKKVLKLAEKEKNILDNKNEIESSFDFVYKMTQLADSPLNLMKLAKEGAEKNYQGYKDKLIELIIKYPEVAEKNDFSINSENLKPYINKNDVDLYGKVANYHKKLKLKEVYKLLSPDANEKDIEYFKSFVESVMNKEQRVEEKILSFRFDKAIYFALDGDVEKSRKMIYSIVNENPNFYTPSIYVLRALNEKKSGNYDLNKEDIFELLYSNAKYLFLNFTDRDFFKGFKVFFYETYKHSVYSKMLIKDYISTGFYGTKIFSTSAADVYLKTYSLLRHRNSPMISLMPDKNLKKAIKLILDNKDDNVLVYYVAGDILEREDKEKEFDVRKLYAVSLHRVQMKIKELKSKTGKKEFEFYEPVEEKLIFYSLISKDIEKRLGNNKVNEEKIDKKALLKLLMKNDKKEKEGMKDKKE